MVPARKSEFRAPSFICSIRFLYFPISMMDSVIEAIARIAVMA